MTDELAERRKKNREKAMAKWERDNAGKPLPEWPPDHDYNRGFSEAVSGFHPYHEALGEVVTRLAELTIPAIVQNCPSLEEEFGKIPPFEGDFGEGRLQGGKKFEHWHLKNAKIAGPTYSWAPLEMEFPIKSGPVVGKELRLFENGYFWELTWAGRWERDPNQGDDEISWLFYGGAITLLNAQPESPSFSLSEFSLDSILSGMHYAFIRHGARPTGALAYKYAEFLEVCEQLTRIVVAPVEPLRALAQR